MSNLVDHARTELEIAGLFRKDSLYGGDLGKAVLQLIRVFAKQGHSGQSAEVVTALFEKVARYEPLTPLTGEDAEWNEVEPGVFQNRRCSRIFRENGAAYDIQGKVFRDPDGSSYTCFESRVPVVFPYVPKTEHVKAQVGP